MSEELNVVKKKQSKKSLATLLLLVGSFVLALGASFAFFTDTTSVSNTMTSATFDMVPLNVGLYEITDPGADLVMGTADDVVSTTPTADGDTTLVPGDSFKVGGTIQNAGDVSMDVRVNAVVYQADGVTPAPAAEWTNTYLTAEATIPAGSSYGLENILGCITYNPANLNALQDTGYVVEVKIEAKQSEHAEWTDITVFEEVL